MYKQDKTYDNVLEYELLVRFCLIMRTYPGILCFLTGQSYSYLYPKC